MRSTPFTARLLAATAICAISATPAASQTYGLQSTDSTPVSNPADNTLYGTTTGVLSTGSALNLDNAGTIRGDGNQAFFANSAGGVVLQGGPGFITNSGSISGLQFGITTIYVSVDPVFDGRAIGSTIDNSGSIVGDNNDGIRLIGGGTVTNSGYIAGRVGAGADGISMFSFEGQDLTSFAAIGSVTNTATGVIEGNRFGVILSNGGSVANAGTISGNSGSILIQGQAVGTEPPRTGTVTNSGTLDGTVQFNGLESANLTNSGSITSPSGIGVYTTAPSGSLTVTNGATGSITGATSGIRSDGTGLTLTNAGTIRGNGSAGSVFLSDGGVIVSGGPASISNSGSISGARFGISTMYFTNSDSSTVGLAIGSTVDNSGSIIGDTDDGIRLIGGGTVTNSGYIAGRVGAGADGISMFAYNGQDTTGMSSIGSVTNLAGGVIEGNRWGVIILGGGTIDNAGTINHGAEVLGSGAGQFGTILNSGSVTGFITLASLDTATLNNSGVAEPVGFSGVTTANLINSGTINYFASFNTVGTAAVNNSGSIGEGLVFKKTTSANVSNSGSITATNTPDVIGTTQDAVYSDAALDLTNTATGSIEGYHNGIRSDGPSTTIENAGTIRGDGTAATLRRADAGILITGGPATITNSGSISGAGYGITTGVYSDPVTNAASGRAVNSTINNSGSIVGDSNDGIRLIGGGTVTNSGYIAGRLGAGADGISMFSQSDQDLTSFTVIGSVTNTATGVIEGNRFGVILSNGGSVANAGTISGNSGSILIQGQAVGTEPPRTGTVTNSGTLDGSVTFNDLASINIANTGTIASNSLSGIVSNFGNGPMSVTNGATGLISGATSGILSLGSSLSLTNAGTIRGNGSYDGFAASPDGGIDVAGGPATIVNSGSLTGQRFGITTSYVFNPNTNLLEGRAVGTTVTNSGTIIGDTDIGVRLIGGGTVTNSGYIAGRIGATADGVWMMAFNDQPLNSFATIGSVTNLVGGVIEGNRRGVTLANGGSVNNAGTISGNAASIRIVAVAGDTGRTGSVTNSGTGTLNGAVELMGLASGNVTNSGTINGKVTFTDVATASVNNSGTISDTLGFTGGTVTVTNSGSLKALTGGQGLLSITNSGSILAVAASSSSLLNSGTISAGVYGSGLSIDNRGSIAGASSAFYGAGSITNTGTISGPTAIDMLTVGSLNNKVGGVVTGANTAVLMENGGTITNAGTITGDLFILNGSNNSLVNSGTLNGNAEVIGLGTSSFVNSGVITGDVLVDGNGNETVTLQTGSSIGGITSTGDTGTDALRLSGTIGTPTASQTIGRFVKFETFNVLSGYWTAPLDTGTFTSTTLTGGALAVNGTLRSPITVNAGAMLAGIGTITGATTMNSGGLLAPGGSSIGTLSITGNVAFNAGSTFSVQTNPNGTSDKLAVTGAVTITKGATLQVLAGIFPNYPATSSYLVVTASGGISGKFDSVVTDYAYFKATVNTQQKGTITVQIAPNGKPLPSAATTTTFSTAMAVDSLGGASPLYQAVLYQSLAGARQAFNALSGSAYARLDAMMDRDVGNVRLGFDGSDSEAPALSWSGVNSLAARGMHSGLQHRHGALSLFMVGGRYTTRLSDSSISGGIDTRFLASAAAYKSGRFRALAAVTSAWHDVAVTRMIIFPGFGERSEARYRATTHRIELEGAYDLFRGPINLAPYAGYAHLMISSPAFGETGGLSALTFGRESRAMDQVRLGVRAATRFHLGSVQFAPHVDADVERVWGAGDPARTARFAGGNGSFDNGSLGFNRRAASVDAGLEVAVGRATLSADYRARRGDQWSDKAAVVTAAVRF